MNPQPALEPNLAAASAAVADSPVMPALGLVRCLRALKLYFYGIAGSIWLGLAAAMWIEGISRLIQNLYP